MCASDPIEACKQSNRTICCSYADCWTTTDLTSNQLVAYASVGFFYHMNPLAQWLVFASLSLGATGEVVRW